MAPAAPTRRSSAVRCSTAPTRRALAEAADFLLGTPPLEIAIVIVRGRPCDRSLRGLDVWPEAPSAPRRGSWHTRSPARADTGELSLRTAARAETLGLVLRSVSAFAIWTIAGLTVLGQLGVNLGPLIAGAGIAGMAFGFGAQSLVKDFLAGIFVLSKTSTAWATSSTWARSSGPRAGHGGVGVAAGHPVCGRSTARCGTCPTARSCGSATSRRSRARRPDRYASGARVTSTAKASPTVVVPSLHRGWSRASRGRLPPSHRLAPRRAASTARPAALEPALGPGRRCLW